jgi:hypothetical protein
MKLIIADVLTQEQKVIEDAEFIPRLGDAIKWSYEPPPRVQAVVIDYDGKTIAVMVE